MILADDISFTVASLVESIVEAVINIFLGTLEYVRACGGRLAIKKSFFFASTTTLRNQIKKGERVRIDGIQMSVVAHFRSRRPPGTW